MWRVGGLVLILAAVVSLPAPAVHKVRIKDITDLQGARGNQLVGFGLVVGLDNTGGRTLLTQQTVVDMLQRFKFTSRIINIDRLDAVFRSANVSTVMVTAELGPFARLGSRLDVTVSVLDDATSLQGGTLILTPLKGADGVDYAVAQGPLTVGGFLFTNPGGSAVPLASQQKNHTTVARIPSGAIVEREARGEVLCQGQLRLLIRDADYATAKAIAKGINGKYPASAFTLDAGTVQVIVPPELKFDPVAFVSEIGQLEIIPDYPARVVINERTGTIVAGEKVKIATVAVAHGNLAISTFFDPFGAVGGGATLGRGATAGGTQGSLGVTEQPGNLKVVEESATVGDMAKALNRLGATPRDIIAIFQSIKKAGALHAELIIM